LCYFVWIAKSSTFDHVIYCAAQNTERDVNFAVPFKKFEIFELNLIV
jgi:hypothetical protein